MEVKIVWIEPICNDETIIERNIRNVKMKSPDYADVPLEEAIADFKQRIKHYEQMYVPVGDNEGSYIKLIDAGKQVIGHKISGYLPARILYFLMHLNLKKVTHFFTQHGESFYNAEGRIGGDSDLSAQGKLYAQQMIDFISMQPQYIQQNLKVWCSTLQRSIKTAEVFLNSSKFKTEVLQWRALTDIEVGICDGMTYAEISHKYPKEFESRKNDKLSYRYPQGESYKDCIKRLEPVIFELERSEQPVLVISHRAILRCLYGYFMDEPLDKIPHIPIELHSVYKLTPTDYSTDMDVIPFGLVSMKKYSSPAVVSNNNGYRFDSPVLTSFDNSLNVSQSNSESDILILDVQNSSGFVLDENENVNQSDAQQT